MPVYSGYRTTKRALGATKTIASKALKMVKAVALKLNVEKKYLDTSFANASCSNTGSYYALSSIAQGATVITRNGNQLKCVKLDFRADLRSNSTTPSVVRIIFFKSKDKVPISSVTEVLESASINAPYNLNYRKDITIIRDRSYNLSDVGPMIHHIKFSKKQKSLIRFTGTGSSDYGHGQYGMIIISDLATVVPTLNGTVRLWFVDN